MNAIVENTVEQVIVENVVEQIVENVVEQIVENVEMPMIVTEKVAKKSVKPSFVTAAHFKQMTVIYYVMKQMEMMNMVSAENMQSMKQLIGIGVSGETIKTFYDELNNGLENMSELLATELEASKPEKKRRVTKKVVDEKPKSIVDALIEIANSSDFPVEPLTVAPVAVTVNAEDKPKRKYTAKKPKAEQAVEAVASVEGEQVVNTETVAVEEKPKRKYTKKSKAVEQVVEAVVNTEGVEAVANTESANTESANTEVVAEKPKRKYAKKPKAVEQVVEAVVNTEQVVEAVVEQVVEAVVNTEQVVEQVIEQVVEQVVEPVVAEKPKAKKTKKPKTEAVVAPNTANTEVVTSEPAVEKPKKAKKTKAVAVVEQVVETETVVADELTKESYDEECSMMVTAITVDGVEYLWDENTDNVYDANTETCIGKLVNNEIVKN